MNQRILYAVASGAVVVAALFAFLPALRHSTGLGIFWGIVAVSLIAVVGVGVNIVSAMFSMYKGYSNTGGPEKVERLTSPAAWTGGTPVPPYEEKGAQVLQFSRSGVTGEQGLEERLDAISELYRVERALSNLQSSRVFLAFRDTQKYQYYQVLDDVRSLIREASKESAESKVAS
jgi:hypothetical protein